MPTLRINKVSIVIVDGHLTAIQHLLSLFPVGTMITYQSMRRLDHNQTVWACFSCFEMFEENHNHDCPECRFCNSKDHDELTDCDQFLKLSSKNVPRDEPIANVRIREYTRQTGKIPRDFDPIERSMTHFMIPAQVPMINDSQ